jgi:hypothetical protein
MKKTKHITLLLILSVALLAESAPQTVCPVMGGKINPKQHVDVEGYRIYVCCGGCIAPIQADPQNFIKKMKADGVDLEKTPTKKDTHSHK